MFGERQQYEENVPHLFHSMLTAMELRHTGYVTRSNSYSPKVIRCLLKWQTNAHRALAYTTSRFRLSVPSCWFVISLASAYGNHMTQDKKTRWQEEECRERGMFVECLQVCAATSWIGQIHSASRTVCLNCSLGDSI